MQRYHWDIYAILEAPQELYFGHEVEINVNRVEVVKLENARGHMEKVYFSPTKRRGVERRTLLWSPHKDGTTLGEVLKCGIPKTCAEDTCPICRVYGALEPGKKTVIGRVTHGGGVAIQEMGPEEKQRAMHPSEMIRDSKGETPIPFRREYNQPGTYYPVYNHVLSTHEVDFSAVGYAFLNMLPRVGAGNPKGARILESNNFLHLVLDRYLVPKGKRPIISPHEVSLEAALKQFHDAANNVREEKITPKEATSSTKEAEKEASQEANTEKIEKEHRPTFQRSNFSRWTGDTALAELERLAEIFVVKHLQPQK